MIGYHTVAHLRPGDGIAFPVITYYVESIEDGTIRFSGSPVRGMSPMGGQEFIDLQRDKVISVWRRESELPYTVMPVNLGL